MSRIVVSRLLIILDHFVFFNRLLLLLFLGGGNFIFFYFFDRGGVVENNLVGKGNFFIVQNDDEIELDSFGNLGDFLLKGNSRRIIFALFRGQVLLGDCILVLGKSGL